MFKLYNINNTVYKGVIILKINKLTTYIKISLSFYINYLIRNV